MVDTFTTFVSSLSQVSCSTMASSDIVRPPEKFGGAFPVKFLHSAQEGRNREISP